MNIKEISINYTYESSIKGHFNCKPNETVKSVCKTIARELKLDFRAINFLVEGTGITPKDYYKNIDNFVTGINKGNLEILVKERNNSESISIQTQDVQVWFAYKFDFCKIKCESDDRIFDVCQKFCNKIGESTDSLSFYYRNQKLELDLDQNFEDIVNKKDLSKKEIKIYVEKNNEKINKNNEQSNNISSSFKKNKKTIIIILALSVVIIIMLIIILILSKKKKNKKNNNDNKINKANEIINNSDKLDEITENIKTDNNEKVKLTDKVIETNEIEEEEIEIVIENKCSIRCMACNRFPSYEECTGCVEGFELYEGLCIKYAFSATYHVEYYSELIQLFNPKKKEAYMQ